jgi:hypothetical protein
MNPPDQPTGKTRAELNVGFAKFQDDVAADIAAIKGTPLTDAEVIEIYREDVTGCSNANDYVPASVSRTLERELAAAKAECAEKQATFDLMFSANLRGIKMWQAAHPGHSETWPDLAKLVAWLLSELTRLRAQLAAIEEDGTEEHNAAVGLRQKLVAALDRAEKAEAERAALAKDKARLDWMLENVGKHYSPMCHDRAAIAAFL